MIRWFNFAKDQLLREMVIPLPGEAISRDEACSLSLTVALRGLGHVSPNPLVGAILVDRDHRFMAAAAHERVGSRHAEANILHAMAGQSAGDGLAGATLYVTLEPCAHEGRTPSCAKALAASGISRVVFGLPDPNPLVSGKGAGICKNAGIEVIDASSGGFVDPTLREWSRGCRDLMAAFLHNTTTGRIFNGLKIASSLDNVVAFEGDRRVWITCDRAREYGHFLRQQYDAIAVGSGTAMADRPRLDVRHSFLGDFLSVRAPRRIVFDPRARALKAILGDPTHPLLSGATIWLVGSSETDTALHDLADRQGVVIVAIPVEGISGRFIWGEVDAKLQALGIRSLLIEGGPGVYDWVLGCGAPAILPDLNRIHLFQSPQILGGKSREGARALRWSGLERRGIAVGQGSVQWIQLDTDRGIEISIGDHF